MKEHLRDVLDYYRAFGFEVLPFKTEKRSIAPAHSSRSAQSETPAVRHSDVGAGKSISLQAVRADIGNCARCKLSGGRKHIVFGEGSLDADIMFIGEAPGREEDNQARPFVGDAGQLLTRLIEKMGFRRQDFYIANIVKCRPPQNRDPEADEVAACFLFLNEQIRIIKPKIIVTLGKVATYHLMKPQLPMIKFSIMRERGKWFEYQGVPVMPTFHPAYLMRNTKDKWLTWEDAQAVLARLRDLRSQDGAL